MTLDTRTLANAASRLREGLDRYQRNIGDDQLRDGLIQRFEFTYELAWKNLQRYIGENLATPSEVRGMPFPDLIRTASEMSVVKSGWPAWRSFRDLRNKTSHTYEESAARDVVAGIPGFLEEVEYMLERFNRHSEHPDDREATIGRDREDVESGLNDRTSGSDSP